MPENLSIIIDSSMSSDDLKDYIKSSLSKCDCDYAYSDMLIYNDLDKNGKIGDGLDSLISIYDKLFNFGLFLSGYQFIGLILDKSFLDNYVNDIYPFAYFMLMMGFIVSLFGALLSFCMLEFLTYSKNETDEYIVKGIVKYRNYLQVPHYVLELNTFCFAFPINIIIYNNLSMIYGIIFNATSVLLVCVGFPLHKKLVGSRQTFCTARINKKLNL